MKKSLILLAAFFSLNSYSQNFVVLHDNPDNFAKILTSTIAKEIYPDKTFIDFSLSQQTACIEEGNCFEEIGKLSDNTTVIYLSRYQIEFERYMYLTFINLNDKIVTRSLGTSCEFCTKLQQIDMIKALLVDNNKSLNGMPSFAVFPDLGLKYPSTIDNEDSLIDFEINTSIPAQIYLNGKYLGESPQKIRANKNTQADIMLMADNHDDFRKTISFKRNSRETFNLIPKMTDIIVRSSPPKATLYVNGKKVGSTPRTLKKIKMTTELKLRFVLENYLENSIIFTPMTSNDDNLLVELERGQALVKVKHDVSDEERKDVFVEINGKKMGTLDQFNNDILIVDAGRNNIKLTKDDIVKEENFKAKIDDFIDWEVAFLETVEITISF
tara:strand:- start:2374 stop:3525 length:1152 start_codon:yes stop_codon:yes gene_type:complete